MDRQRRDSSDEAIPTDPIPLDDSEIEDELDVEGEAAPEPPFTTTRHMTSPKFGSAGSGGAELEPGPDR